MSERTTEEQVLNYYKVANLRLVARVGAIFDYDDSDDGIVMMVETAVRLNDHGYASLLLTHHGDRICAEYNDKAPKSAELQAYLGAVPNSLVHDNNVLVFADKEVHSRKSVLRPVAQPSGQRGQVQLAAAQ